MPKLLHLACSPRADSESAAGARVFMESFRKARPDWEIDAMNLWREPLPEFEGYLLEAKYARIGGKTFTNSQHDAFAVAERLALRLSLADRVLEVASTSPAQPVPQTAYLVRPFLDVRHTHRFLLRIDLSRAAAAYTPASLLLPCRGGGGPH